MKNIFLSSVLVMMGITQVQAQTVPPAQFSANCYVRFSPKGGAEFAIVDRINHAQQSIEVQAYNFASKPIADALIAAFKRGVKVVALIDSKQPNASGAQLRYIRDAGIPVFLDANHQISHNKVMIIDGIWVHTGSFNFSANAENHNAENSVWCKSPGMVKAYQVNFDAHMTHGKPFTAGQ